MEYLQLYILFTGIFYFLFGSINQNVKITSRYSGVTGWFRGKSATVVCLILEVVLIGVGYVMVNNLIDSERSILQIVAVGLAGLLTAYWVYKHTLST